MIILYNFLLLLGVVLGFPLITPIVLTTDKRRKTFLQRLGISSLPEGAKRNRHHDPEKRPIWVHALSVGEIISAVSLVKRLKESFRDKNIVFSVSTQTGFEIANELLKETVDSIFFFPYDFAFSVKHIAGKIDPAFVLIVESDIWPNFLFEMKKRNLPVILVNARLSKKSFTGYERFLFFTKSLFLSFSKICAQSMADAQRFRSLGVPSNRITITGNVKFDQECNAVQHSEIEHIKQSMHIQPSQKILLAGSTHNGEELILLDAFSRIKKDFADLLLIVTPRDPARSGSVCQMFNSAGFSAALMKELKRIHPDKIFDVIVIDAIGILRKLYALADAAFVGGSLVKCGGHNPLEPAAFSKPVIFGPDMDSFVEISQMLLESGGAVQIQDAKGLYQTVTMLLTDDTNAQEMGTRAFKVFYNNKGAVEKTLKVIENCFHDSISC